MPQTAVDRALRDYFVGHGEYQDLRLGDRFRSSVGDQLMRSIGSLQSQSLNRIGTDLPLATQLSLRRGIAQSGQEQVQEGLTGLERFMATSNRDALMNLLGLKQQQEIVKMQQPSPWEQLLGTVGQGLGLLAGNG